MTDDELVRMQVFWTITTPMPTGRGGATITNGVAQSTSGFDWDKLDKTFKAVVAQFDPSVLKTIDDSIKLEVRITIDAMPRLQRERAD
jgi:hypothetical protein